NRLLARPVQHVDKQCLGAQRNTPRKIPTRRFDNDFMGAKTQILRYTSQNARGLLLESSGCAGASGSAIRVEQLGKFHDEPRIDEATPLRGVAPQGKRAGQSAQKISG
ncbi:hypothetical protein P0D73_31540, partial [Paraburkholderia sp. RL18-101-BIB-B]|uniref:hypothetical protein n=1 Tax=Paraburkholderia sp. RL18-101-BIB-B TaxID=3031634 RepID=UPI0038B96FAA